MKQAENVAQSTTPAARPQQVVAVNLPLDGLNEVECPEGDVIDVAYAPFTGEFTPMVLFLAERDAPRVPRKFFVGTSIPAADTVTWGRVGGYLGVVQAPQRYPQYVFEVIEKG